MNTSNVSKTNYAALLRLAVKNEDGTVNLDATTELVRSALLHGPNPSPDDGDLEVVSAAVHAHFDGVERGKKVPKAKLLEVAREASPEFGSKLLEKVLANGEFKPGVGRLGGWARLADVDETAAAETVVETTEAVVEEAPASDDAPASDEQSTDDPY